MKKWKYLQDNFLVLINIILFISLSILIYINNSLISSESLKFTSDIPIENSIFRNYVIIEGEVNNPGEYEFFENETLDQLLLRTKNKTSLSYIPIDQLAYKLQPFDRIKLFTINEFQNLINLNSASYEELITLPGIGDKTALAIISARPFLNIVELKNINGIGDTKFDSIVNLITIYTYE